MAVTTRLCLTAIAPLMLLAGPAGAQQQPAPAAPATAAATPTWITLGTRGGPMADAKRSQPANALVIGNDIYLVDAGDGAVEQLAKAGIPLARVKGVFLSHLHFDHTGGLAALLGLRWQTSVPGTLPVYGPPGTAKLVAGLIASMEPGVTAGYGLLGAPARPAENEARAIEIRDGAVIEIGGMRVTAAKNSHFSFPPGSDFDRQFESLALRFDTPGRSIAYTGDTGPSAAVEKLAKGADLLVSEMMDVERTMAAVRINSPTMDPKVIAGIEQHLKAHHLTPADVGKLAAAAGVKAVVITHYVAPEANGGVEQGFLREILERYRGPVTIAEDLEEF